MNTSNPNLSQFLDTSALAPLNTDTNCFKNSKKSKLHQSFADKFQT